MSRRRNAARVAVFAAGALAGAALEEIVSRRLVRRPDPEASERIGSIPAESIRVRSFDGTALSVRVYGPPDADDAIVFVHGAIETHALWHYQVRDLLTEGRYRLVAYDARGHGASGPPRGPDGNTPLTGYTLARDLVAVVDRLGPKRAILVGHSMGAMTIQALWHHGEIAHLHGCVTGIVLVNSTYTADLRGWRGRGSVGERAFERIEDVMQRIPLPASVIDRIRPGTNDLSLLLARFVYGKDPSPHHIATSVQMYEAAASETLTAFIDLAHFDVHDALPSIDVPALVVAGTKDRLTPCVLAAATAERIPGAELVVWEDCGHTAPFERHDELTAHLRKFAERVLA